MFFAVTFLAIGVLYLYVAPGLQTRLIDEKLTELAAPPAPSGPIARTVGAADSLPVIRRPGRRAPRSASGERVTLLSVVDRGRAARAAAVACRPTRATRARQRRLGFRRRGHAARSGTPETGTESTASGTVAEAAYPVTYQGRVVRVIVYSAPVSDIVRNVAIVRHEILVAGGIALLLALVGGYLVARALAQRVKRLELAAERVAAGEFEHPIPVDSTDELGQLAVAFNEMQRQLAQLDLARKKFIATASHELRTPIFSLGGFVELLEDEELDAETRRRFLEQVRDQVERLRKLSVDLLDLSTLESGSLELRPEQVDLGELTRSVSGEFEPTLAQHDSHLELRLPARRIEAMCDPVRVAQIMRILIDNALTHTPPGTRIVVTAGRDDGHVRLAVRDDGDGHRAAGAAADLRAVLHRRRRPGLRARAGDRERARRADGGRLSVDSAPGDTVFTLELPS